jgi:branched-chain amino acid transport system substrate-binding protein
MNKQFKVILASLMASATVGIVCLQQAHAQSGDEIRIGIIASETGAVSFLGDPFIKSVRLAVEQVNETGGINGKKIKLISYDDESSPDKALTFAKRLVAEDKVAVILGPSISSTTRAILPTTDAAGIPIIYNTPIIEPPSGSFQFSVFPSEEASYRVALKELQKRGVKKLGMLASTDTTGESGVKWIEKLADSYGLTLVAKERFDLQDKDMTAQLTKIKGAGVDAVFAPLSGSSVAVVCKGYIRLGMKQPLVVSTGAVTIHYPNLLKGITPDTLIFPTYKVVLGPDAVPASDPSRKVLDYYFKTYQAKWGQRPDATGGSGYDAANVIFQALKTANSTEPAKIRDALYKVKNFAGTNVVVSFAPDQHRGAGPNDQRMGQFKDGKFLMLKD